MDKIEKDNPYYDAIQRQRRIISNLEGDRQESEWQIQLYKNKIREIQERQLPKIDTEQEEANVELRMLLKEAQK